MPEALAGPVLAGRVVNLGAIGAVIGHELTHGFEEVSPMRSKHAGAVLLAGALVSACATTKPPSLRVQGLDFGKVGITGVSVDVAFMVRNVNAEPLLIERFEYELAVNGERLGRGYYAEPIRIEGFGEERVVSRFDVNFLNVPGTVRAVLERDTARARARGKFYVRKGDSLQSLSFDDDAEVRIRR